MSADSNIDYTNKIDCPVSATDLCLLCPGLDVIFDLNLHWHNSAWILFSILFSSNKKQHSRT